MRLTGLDLLFWAAGFSEHLALLLVLWVRGRARSFPFFAALITVGVVKTIVLYFVLHHGSRTSYFYAYWALTLLDTTAQLCVVYEVASRVFRPLDVWDREVRASFLRLLIVSVVVAFFLLSLASPPAPTWMQSVTTKCNLFAAALMSELFVAMMALSVMARFPWRTHVAKIAQGLGAYSLVSVCIEAAHSYFGVGREVPSFLLLSHIRMAAYLGCVTYWIVTLWSDEPSREMTVSMREKIFTLQTQLQYHLQDLRSRTK